MAIWSGKGTSLQIVKDTGECYKQHYANKSVQLDEMNKVLENTSYQNWHKKIKKN